MSVVTGGFVVSDGRPTLQKFNKNVNLSEVKTSNITFSEHLNTRSLMNYWPKSQPDKLPKKASLG